ncbi:M23 family metallopeptidase [Streptomyces sp. NPDC094448]|uniref:M23 family metallopeptidase n=1 Tax=Streptomyces sp. NPDC094448 TaxID=3366063 RepID=UPI0038081E74
MTEPQHQPVTPPAERRGRDRLNKGVAVGARVCWWLVIALILLDLVLNRPGGWWLPFVPAAVAIALDLLRSRFDTAGHRDAGTPAAVLVDAPVSGRWLAHNSPADKVPSHGTHQLAQSYAIDIVAAPADGPESPAFRWVWPPVRRSSAFPAFGAPLLAVADGTVVRARDGQRDHLSRNSLPMVVYLMLVEAFVRSLRGPWGITGNHVVLDLGNGTYALYAHVKRGSLTVGDGDRVRAGQTIGACGNSGNSTEPHVHFQLMDGPDPETARGIPFRWRGVGLPENKEIFTAPEPGTGPEPAAASPAEPVPPHHGTESASADTAPVAAADKP